MPESTGALTEAVYYILLSLYKSLHGYAIMQHVSEISGGRVKLGAGTLYGALNTLCERGWIRGDGGDTRKKDYIITELGKRMVEAEMTRLRELLTNGEKIVGRII